MQESIVAHQPRRTDMYTTTTTFALRERKAVKFPLIYSFVIVAAVLDILLTTMILNMGGTELNPIVAAILEDSGIAGMATFKFGWLAMVLIIVEAIPDVRARTARVVAIFWLVTWSFPPVYAIGQIVMSKF
jgi:hypothetical protein